MTRARTRTLVALALALAGLVVACDEDVLQDPNFHLWCGDHLCSWELEQGHVKRIPTWHEDDYGVELVDTPTAMSQLSHESPNCLRFTTVARIDERAQVTLDVDFDDDGSVDFSYPIPTSDWHQVETLITPPPGYSGARFRVVKHGSGVAQLAMLRVQSTTGCAPAQAVHLHDLPIGERCGGDGTECKGGLCCFGVCSECCPDAQLCAGPSCAAHAACAGSATCAMEPGATADFFSPFPLQCAPGQHLGAAGAPCILDTDCASSSCDGASFRYRTTGTTTDAGLDCVPAAGSGPLGTTDCRAIAARGGTCR